MGLLETKEHEERLDVAPRIGQRWEYLARNLGRVLGPALEKDFNKHGEKGWEFVAVADGYAIFKRPAGA